MSVRSHAPRAGLGALWFGVLAGPVIWSLLSVVNYVLAAQSCAPAGMQLSRPLFPSVRMFAGALTLVGIAIVTAALVTAVRSHVAANHAAVPRDAVWSRVHFMALAGIITSAVFLVGIVLHGIAVIVLPACL